MLGLFDWIKIGGGVVIGASLATAPAYLSGKSAGRTEAQVASVAKSVEVLRERNTIDDQVSVSDAAALCGSYGLPEQDRLECMRRVVEASPLSRNDGDNPAH